MRGVIKFLSKPTRTWGFIVPDDGSSDVHFGIEAFMERPPVDGDAGAAVTFRLEQDDRGKRRAHDICFVDVERALAVPEPPVATASRNARQRTSPGSALTDWAFIPMGSFKGKDGTTYQSAWHLLASLALDEKWHFGATPNPKRPWPILENYIRYTFFKLQKDGQISEASGDGRRWATFNTGLVDKLYDPIYALFEQNDRPAGPAWYFYDFGVPGRRASGKKLTAVFDPLPDPPQYFSSNFDMLLDTSKDIHVEYEHVILDGIRRGRFAPEFVAQHTPKGFKAQDYSILKPFERKDYLQRLSEAIELDVQCMRAIKRRLEDAKLLAEKRIRWNFKTAIPQYHPRMDSMSLLLPLAIMDDEVVDIALVVTRNPSGSYQGRTVFPLDWAYQSARLVCRPDSDWLVPQSVHGDSDATEDD